MRQSPLPVVLVRGIALLLAGAALYATPALADEQPGASASQTPYVVAGTVGFGLVLRMGPSFDQPVLGVLPEGTSVQILNGPISDGQVDWYFVQLKGAGTMSGYGSGAYLVPPDRASVASPAPAPPNGGKVIPAIVTGYANGADGGAVGTTTASGTQTRWGTVAADVRMYPFGTRILVEGFDGVLFVVEDTGSAVHGNIFDIWFPDVPTAAAFGTQRRQVTILPPGS